MLRRLSIPNRLVLLSGVLVAILAATTLYTTAKLAANSRAVSRAAEVARQISRVDDIRTSFGEYRYWMTDLAVSLLRQSQMQATSARQRIASQLDRLAPLRPDLADELKNQIDAFTNDATRAVDEYTDDQRVVGNTFLARLGSIASRLMRSSRPSSPN